MARDATELVKFLDESTRKRKQIAAEQQEAVSVATTSLEPHACIEQTENDISLLNGKTVSNGSIGLCISDKLKEDVLGLGDNNIHIMKKMKWSNFNDSLAERISLKNGENSADVVENDQRSENSHASSISSDGKGVSHAAGKSARTTAERLWDGSLHLNSSVSVSAVAFFKSGEKMCDVKWSDIAEVIGKVRLDSFERYVQDLSRSRNRGLMVISLCWKEGSSISGLEGMKKVAKGYKEEERVGFVKLAPGVDLYVCPCSDTIITILAKHGFFKGMSAVVDNKDSLIGCVVRRKNGASTSCATNKSDSKNCSLSEHPLNSSFGSSNKKSAEKELSSEQPIQKSIPIARETESITLESAGSSGDEGKHLKSSEVQLGLCNSSAIANISPTSSVLRPETFPASNCAIDSAPLKGSMSQSSEVEAPSIHKSSMERPKLSLVPQKPVLSLSSDVAKQPTPTLDDLPEFDFGNACGIRQTPKSVHDVTIDKKLLTEGSRKMDGSMQPTVPTLQSPSTFNKQRSEISNPTMFPLNEIQSMPLLKKVNENEPPQTTQSRGIRLPVTATAVNSENIFNDGMPEWHPPTVELCKLAVPQITSPSTTYIPLKVPNSTTSIPLKLPNSTFGSFTFRHPRPLLVVPPITSPSTTSSPLKVPNSTTTVPLKVPNSTTSIPLKVPNSTTSIPLKVPNSTTSASLKVPNSTTSVPLKAPNSTTSVLLKVPNSTTFVPLKVPNSTLGSFTFRHPSPSLVVPRITSPSTTSGPLNVPNSTTSVSLKVPNSTFGSFTFRHPSPLQVVPRITSPSITSGPLKVSNSTTSGPLKVPNSTFGSFTFMHPSHSLVVPWITSPPITSGSLKVPNATVGSFSSSHPRPSQGTYPHCGNHAFPGANYCSIDTTVKAVAPTPPERYVLRRPGSSMVFGANPLLRPPPNPFAVNGWRP